MERKGRKADGIHQRAMEALRGLPRPLGIRPSPQDKNREKEGEGEERIEGKVVRRPLEGR